MHVRHHLPFLVALPLLPPPVCCKTRGRAIAQSSTPCRLLRCTHMHGTILLGLLSVPHTSRQCLHHLPSLTLFSGFFIWVPTAISQFWFLWVLPSQPTKTQFGRFGFPLLFAPCPTAHPKHPTQPHMAPSSTHACLPGFRWLQRAWIAFKILGPLTGHCLHTQHTYLKQRYRAHWLYTTLPAPSTFFHFPAGT